MSGAQTSTFAPPNVLLNTLSGAQTAEVQQNQLMNQGRQLDLSNANMEQVSRVAAALLNEPDPGKRAELYPRYVGSLQSQGYAMHAPATLPDEGTLQMLARQGTPSQTQAEWAQNLAANKAYLNANNPPATPGTGAGTTATPGTAAAPSTIEPTALTSATAVRDGLIKRGMDAVTATAFAANKLHESGGTLDSGPGDGGASQGNFMWNGDRNTEYQQLYGHTPQGAPLDEQLDFVVHELNGKESNARDAINAAEGVDGKASAISRYYLRPKDVVGEAQRRSATALQLQRQIASTAQPGAPGGATAPGVAMGDATRPDLAPPPPGGTAGIPAPYQATGGGIGSVLGGTARVARPTSPAGAPVITDQPAGGNVVAGPPGAAVVGQPTPPSAAVPGNVNAINAGIARAGGAPAQAVTPEPGWGTAIGTYGPQSTPAPPPAPLPPPPAPAPMAQPGVRQPPQPPQPPPAAPLPPPPQMPVLNGNGLTDLQQRQVNALAANPQNKQPAVAAAQQAFVNQNIQLRQQAFSDYMQQQQLAVQQGTLSNAQAELNLKTWQAAHPAPTTPRFTQSSAVWNPDTKQYEPVTPANANLGTPVTGHWGVNNTGQQQFFADSPAAIQRLKEAETSGAAAGTQTVQLYNGIIARAQAAQKSESDIDYASNQLAQAAKGGQTTGFFSPAMATAAAVAKSLGIDTTKLGVDPNTVGNIQSAQKTLAVLGASILQQALGKESQITDAKIQAYEHTQPGIENDPQALQRIMAWARSQFTYERELGHAAAAAARDNGGILPPTFLPGYYADVGFAPVYDSVSGEMRQPDGRQPERETPPPVSTARVPQEGDTATGKDGHKIVLRGGNWVPQVPQ